MAFLDPKYESQKGTTMEPMGMAMVSRFRACGFRIWDTLINACGFRLRALMVEPMQARWKEGFRSEVS